MDELKHGRWRNWSRNRHSSSDANRTNRSYLDFNNVLSIINGIFLLWKNSLDVHLTVFKRRTSKSNKMDHSLEKNILKNAHLKRNFEYIA